jgi:hypothetical protein
MRNVCYLHYNGFFDFCTAFRRYLCVVRTVVLSGWILYWVVILSQALFFRFIETAFVFLFFIAFTISRMREATRIFSFKPYAVSILQENSKQAVTRCMV